MHGSRTCRGICGMPTGMEPPLVMAWATATPLRRTLGGATHLPSALQGKCSGSPASSAGRGNDATGWRNAGPPNSPRPPNWRRTAHCSAADPTVRGWSAGCSANSQEGERLQRLRERLWRDIPWTQGSGAAVGDAIDDLGPRSPSGLPEGVTVLCDNDADRSRLDAQMDLLEPEHQQLLTGNLDALPASQAFDWIGGRLASAACRDRTGWRWWRPSTNMPSRQQAYGF